MTIPRSTWEQTQYNLVQDILDLFLPPRYTFSVETNYPKTASMEALLNDRFNTLDLPEPKLLRLGELLEESWPEDFPRKEADWAIVFTCEVLEGFGHGLASNLQGAAFEGLKQLADTWGLYLAKEVERLFHKWQLFTAFTDFIFDLLSMFLQIPPKELGETIRESATPAYLRAGETVAYELALFHNDQARMRESLGILLASDAELERQIANIFSGYSTTQVGRRMQRMLITVVSQLRELFTSNEFRNEFNDKLPTAVLIACRNISWYIGRRLSRNLQYDPQRSNRLLEAVNHHREIPAVFEQYRCGYSWDGDRTKAIRLGWWAVAPKYFHFSSRKENIEEDIHEDEWQEKFIGVAQGLENYTDKNPAIDAMKDGFLGKLGAYLMRAAKNEETDYVRKQTTDGNIALTDARHTEDLRHSDKKPDREENLSDEEILSREKEKYHPSRDPVADEVEAEENYRIWYRSLTEQEKTAVALSQVHDNQEDIAEQMEISQQRVSQLLLQALEKLRKINR